MEQLSAGAIGKLWELCSKVMPGFGRSEGGGGGGGEAAAMEEGSPPADRAGAKNRKKNKPMNAREQEERINQLTRVQEQFRQRAHGQGGSPQANESIHAATSPVGGQEESSEESDSEEE